MCGELSNAPPRPFRWNGSSPRVRGTLGSLLGVRAGTPVHPRVCGELAITLFLGLIPTGSSPRVRGTRRGCRGCRRSRSVHPRVCGELSTKHVRSGPRAGSSPRVRGTLVAWRGRRDGERFIPACAGNSTPPAKLGSRPPVHPRVCGELWMCAGAMSAAAGSSPRVRGTRAAGEARCADGRFIPACAGNSWRRSPPAPPGPVHPRVCGELVPRTQGHRRTERFIPACAGNSSGYEFRDVADAGSSPACAGNSITVFVETAPVSGSSPRVRGTRARSLVLRCC